MSLEQARKDIEKQKNEESLIADLVALAAEIKKAQAVWLKGEAWEREQKRQYDKIIRSALSKKDSGIHIFHRVHALGTAIKQVEKQLGPYNIPKQVISDLLKAGGYAPLESDVYSAVSPTRTSFALFSAEDRESLAIKQRSLKSSALALGVGLGGVGLFTALALLIKSAVVVKTAVTVMAVAAAASATFPPALIALAVIGGAALLIAAIGIAAIAIKHYRDSQVGTKERINEYQLALSQR